jgi:plasmid stabilization system protein ParE
VAYGLTWAPAARLDLKDLAAYIAEDNPAAARSFVRSVFRIVERLSEFPESGRMVPEFNDRQIREVVRKPCRIVYRIKREERNIEIVRVWHAARGIPEL